MPCVCGNKVDRAQPKVQCAKCNNFFHTVCVDILPSDLEFMLSENKNFFCKLCTTARRNSIRSPPPSAAVENVHPVEFVTTAKPTSLSTKPPTIVKPTATTSDDSKKHDLSLESMCVSIDSLRAENSRLLNLLSTLHGDNLNLQKKMDTMYEAVIVLQQSLIKKDEAIALLSAEVKDLHTVVKSSLDKSSNDNIRTKKFSAATRLSSSRTTDAALFSSVVTSHLPHSSPTLSSGNATAASIVSNCSNTQAAAAMSREAKIPAEPLRRSSPSITTPTSASTASINFAAAAAANINTSTAPILFADAAASHMSTEEVNLSSVPILHDSTNNQNTWTTIQGRRRSNSKRSRNVVFGLNATTELDVVATNKWLHLASFKPSVTEDNIITYVAKNSNIDRNLILCFKLVKKDTDIHSLKKINFKLGVPPSLYDQILKPSVWPADVKVRPFKFFQRDEPTDKKI